MKKGNYIGVTIDKQLTFYMHVQTQVAKANKILGYLRHIIKYLTSTIFLQLYKAMIRPHLEYASCIWFPKLKRDSDAIKRIQRRATKLVPELCTLTYTERLRQLKLPTLVYRRRRADTLQTYKLMHNFNQLDRALSIMPTKKNAPAVSNPVHSRPQFEVIYSGSQRGAFELFCSQSHP